MKHIYIYSCAQKAERWQEIAQNETRKYYRNSIIYSDIRTTNRETVDSKETELVDSHYVFLWLDVTK